MMDVVVIGLGSMGRRRIRLLQQYDSSITIIGVDSNVSRLNKAREEFGIITFCSLEDALRQKSPQCAFVSTSPLSHSGIIHVCLEKGINVFTEINLVDDQYEENLKLAKKNDLVLFLSSTFMFRKEVEYIKKTVDASQYKMTYSYHVGQYLPDWHPWESYKNFFVGDSRTDGCRELMAIELPWIIDVFGFPNKWSVQSAKTSLLEVDYPDTYQILFSHANGNMGFVQFDVVSRKAVRHFECIAEDCYLSWDGTPEGLFRYDYVNKKSVGIKLYDRVDKRSDYSESIIEDAYYSEIMEFFDVIKNRSNARYSFEKDKEVLSIIDSIEERN